jgi:hypothetical protein
MRLGALTKEQVRQAIAIYQDLAYGAGGRPRRGVELPASGGSEALLALFQKEQVETIPGHPCHRYSMRLGNRNYPFMKLLLQEHLVAGEFFFAVDTHDQMEIAPNFPDYEAVDGGAALQPRPEAADRAALRRRGARHLRDAAPAVDRDV